MPLGRFGLRNEYGLGVKELYKDGVESEDPKAVLDGVAVAGLVGLLRQLGDLSQFAAEVFHGLQEQVASTSSRSRKLVTRVQHVEASLPALEKAILSQTSHIHFAYSPGSEWHPRSKIEQNHFICDDLPHFIMDSYEECREPPRLQSLDRFDTGGPGSCLKRYSDPTFFRRASASSEARNREKSLREKKARKIKRRRSWQRSGQLPNYVPNMNNSERVQKSSQTSRGESSLSHTGSTLDSTFRSDMGDQSDFLNSKHGRGSVDSISHPSIKTQPANTKNMEIFLNMDENLVETSQTNYLHEQTALGGKGIQGSSATETLAPQSSNVTWDEKLEIMEHMGLSYGIEDAVQHDPEINSYIPKQGLKPAGFKSINHVDDLPEQGSISNSDGDQQYTEAVMNLKSTKKTGLNYRPELDVKLVDANNSQVDSLSELASSSESDAGGNCARTTTGRKCIESSEVSFLHEEIMLEKAQSFNLMENVSKHVSSTESDGNENHPTSSCDWNMDLTGKATGINEVQDFDEANFDLHEHDFVQEDSKPNPELTNFSEGENAPDGQDLVLANSKSSPEVTRYPENENSPKLITDGNFLTEPSYSKLSVRDIRNMLENNDNKDWAIETIDENHVGTSFSAVTNLSEGEIVPELNVSNANFVTGHSDSKLGIGAVKNMPETNLDNAKLEAGTVNDEFDYRVDACTEGVNNVTMIEWHHHDDIDSETDNFVDALNTIESESESDYENYTKRRVKPSTSTCKPAENVSAEQLADMVEHSDPEHECQSRPCDQEDGVYDVSEQPTSCPSLANLENLENSELSLQLKAASGQERDKLARFSHELSVQSPLSSCNVNADSIILQQGVCLPVEPSSQASHDYAPAGTPDVSGEIPNGSIGSYPPAFWSNGTLLGLQPSKPTVISTSNSVKSAPISKGNSDSVEQSRLKINGPTTTTSMLSLVKNIDHGHDIDSDSQDGTSFRHISHDVLDKNNNQSLNCDNSAIPDQGNGHAVTDEIKVPCGADLRSVNSEATSTSEDRLSLLSLLGRNLLQNGLRRNGSLDYDEKSKTGISSTASLFDNKCDAPVSDSVSQSNLNVKSPSPVDSPPPSPPLELMKISFKPVDRFESAKLKLKYPEGIDHQEITVETFPSFQLVPESISVQHNMGSDSDDDTFCRSYPCISDDSLSDLSDSDSERWESGDTSENNDHAFHDGLRRISSTDSASSSSQHDETDQGSKHVSSRSLTGVQSMLGPTSQLLILDTEKKFGYAEMQVCLNPEADSSHLQDLAPQLPPLPPLQWRISRAVLDEADDEPKQGFDNLNRSIDSHLLVSAISHPSADKSAELQSKMQELDTVPREKEIAEPKSNQKQNHHVANGNAVDDRGDFLHQIRTKSFNLKRTDTARSFSTPSLPTSNKVTAILQKASAIRQVVGSDGEDSWSDT